MLSVHDIIDGAGLSFESVCAVPEPIQTPLLFVAVPDQFHCICRMGMRIELASLALKVKYIVYEPVAVT